jgi:hypothetical protein
MRAAGVYREKRKLASLNHRQREALDHAKQLVGEAVWTYDPKKGAAFSTFAWNYSVFKVSERMHVAFNILPVPGSERTNRNKCVPAGCYSCAPRGESCSWI